MLRVGGGSVVVGDGDGVVVGRADLIAGSRRQGEDHGLVVFVEASSTGVTTTVAEAAPAAITTEPDNEA